MPVADRAPRPGSGAPRSRRGAKQPPPPPPAAAPRLRPGPGCGSARGTALSVVLLLLLLLLPPPASCCAGATAGSGGAAASEGASALMGTMAALARLLWASSVVLVVWAGFCSAVCVEVPSETEAVQGTHMKLLCISCMKREEVTASTVVEWFYRPEGGKDEPIYEYRKTNHEFPSRFSGRLQWNGSKDMQDVSITVLNVTLNDSGIYTCNITREFEFEIHRPLFTSSRLIHLTVVEEAGEDFTSVISEIMMYILLVFLTLWLLIEMVYCYRKVSKAEEAAQENATDYLAIPSENKENCAVPVEE
ncbi:sodium channel subunit beta-3 [Neopsephotus bourkii]|uniref:sodium channel subunit beta-3 n=1 Tax=Neopsephotus bourkii TaxID=309878 RepID=UPI002AA5DDAE|nr:sodium channel subunit beta-3 [Neopsephotus bourkii]XP_061224475.1 sodium channel subunit beta-3 [Neopsephotus bourkii]